jgi:hypothetical protein
VSWFTCSIFPPVKVSDLITASRRTSLARVIALYSNITLATFCMCVFFRLFFPVCLRWTDKLLPPANYYFFKSGSRLYYRVVFFFNLNLKNRVFGVFSFFLFFLLFWLWCCISFYWATTRMVRVPARMRAEFPSHLGLTSPRFTLFPSTLPSWIIIIMLPFFGCLYFSFHPK